MEYKFQQMEVDRRGDVFVCRLKNRRMAETDLLRLGEELAQLIEEDGCRLMALSLGFDQIDCLYSMFIGKLVATRRLLLEQGGHLHLCEVGATSLGVLKTCRLTELFEIHSSVDDAVHALRTTG